MLQRVDGEGLLCECVCQFNFLRKDGIIVSQLSFRNPMKSFSCPNDVVAAGREGGGMEVELWMLVLWLCVMLVLL